jgi:tRNA(Ile)-lysidine synthase
MDSRADARFVRRAAARLGLDFIREKGDVMGFAHANQVSVEMAARRLRHCFLAKSARSVGASAIALAHQADDQVELFFLRLFRGAGAEGLAGMDWQGPSPEDRGIRLIRPLLEERREAIGQFARENHIKFREDSSNRRLSILRNRIRHRLLPLLRRRYQAALDPVILRTMTTLRADAEFIADEANTWQHAQRKTPFARLPPALQRHLLGRQLRQLNVEVGFDLIERLRRGAGERVSIGGGEFLKRDVAGKVLKTGATDFSAEQVSLSLESQAGQLNFGEIELSWRIVTARRHVRRRTTDRSRMEVFDADKVGSEILLRHWRPGDRFQPIGLPQTAKLQDLFVNQRIPRERRHRLVVATTRAGDIFWVEDLRIAEGFKLDKATRRGLNWSWRRTEPMAKGRVAPAHRPW